MPEIEFPSFERLRVQFPLRSGQWTIWPDEPQNQGQWFIGHPLELRPMRWDFLDVACDGDRLEIKPHYLKSTWDTFWTGEDGCVEVQALGGLFPVTLGRQPELIAGIREVILALGEYLKDQHADVAKKLLFIERLLFGAECRACTLSVEARGGPVPGGPRSMRASASRAVWRLKMGKPVEPAPPVTPQ